MRRARPRHLQRTVRWSLFGLTLAGTAPPSEAQDRPADVPPVFTLTIRPERDGGAEVVAIRVASELGGWPASERQAFRISAPIVYAGVTGIADRVRDLEVRDASGPVPLRTADDPPAPGGFPYFRHWHAERPLDPPVSIAYRSLVRPTGERNSPPFGIRPAGGGVSGAGSGFLVLPAGDGAIDARVRWDLEDLAAGSKAASSFGDGDFELTGPASRLLQGWYMAGPVGRFPSAGDEGGFSATWLGDAPFDAVAEMERAAGLYADLGAFFRYLDPPPRYRVFMRFLETPPFGGGTALPASFMLSRAARDAGGPDSATGDDAIAEARVTFAHEMIHQWVGGIEAPQGVSSWFSEGLTTHYTRSLLMRLGRTPVAAYGEEINETFRAYFTSRARNLSADSIAAVGFGDPAVRRIPYWRGSFYFADLDARIRAASGGTRDLDAFLLERFERRAAGESLGHDAWVEAVVREIGPEGRRTFESVILGGETIVPASEAFGPCFRRRPVRWTAAAGEVDGFEWERVPGIPDEACRRG